MDGGVEFVGFVLARPVGARLLGAFGLFGENGGHACGIDFRVHALEVGDGELERVENHLGAGGVEAAVEQGVDDLIDSELDGFGVFEGTDVNGGVEGESDGVTELVAGLGLVMEVTELVAAKRGRSADDAVGLDVGAGGDGIHGNLERNLRFTISDL